MTHHAVVRSRHWLSRLLLACLATGIAAATASLAIQSRWSLPASPAKPHAAQPEAPMPLVTTFHHHGNVFQFDYPSLWRPLERTKLDALSAIMFSDVTEGRVVHMTGVVAPPTENAVMSALVSLAVIENPTLVGGLSDEQALAGRMAAERQLADRMLTYERRMVDGLPAVHCVHVSEGGECIVQQVIAFAHEPGIQYVVTCMAPSACHSEVAPDFMALLSSLRIARDGVFAPIPWPTIAPGEQA